MIFKDALVLLKNGVNVKLPSWSGYWRWDDKLNTIIIHTKDGVVMDIRETQVVEYTLNNILSDKWIIATEENTPILGGEALFDFDEALKYIKRNIEVKRKYSDGCITMDDKLSIDDIMAKDWMFA